MPRRRVSTLRVYGYHGTSQSSADAILKDPSSFRISRKSWDWLGDGVYFWQDARHRAWRWARNPPHMPARHDPAVLVARIRLADCMDLLDIHWADYLRDVHSQLLRDWERQGRKPPVQTAQLHLLDRLVINRAIQQLERRRIPVRVVRAPFTEGEPIFPTSYLHDQSHVQIAVRDYNLIESLWLDTAPK